MVTTPTKCCVAVGTWCVGFSNELLLAKEMESKKLQQELRYFMQASNLILGPVPIKAAIEHHKTHKLQLSDDIPFQVFHFWTTSFDTQAKKGGFHAWAQFEFSRCWPGVVNMCPLSQPPCIGSS